MRLVYEDQGPPFLMEAGDCVLQPPRIRHRVLESSPGLEVVEIGCPALHETLADHDTALPTGVELADRDFGGQTFLHQIAARTPWASDHGLERRDCGIARATGSLADAYVLRPSTANAVPSAPNGGELLFGFMLEGSAALESHGRHALRPTDAFVIPPGEAWGLSALSPDANVLIVTSTPF